MNTASIDLYAVLGVPQSADKVAIRKAFRVRMRQTHPDRRPPEDAQTANEEMILLNLAYETLSDPGKRAVYDSDRRAATNAKREPRREPPPPSRRPRVVVIKPQVVDFGSVAAGEIPPDQVVTVSLSDGSIIRYAWALKDRGDFWQVVEPGPFRDVSAVRLRLRVRPLSSPGGLGLHEGRLRLVVDDLIVLVPVCINGVEPTPPPPPPRRAPPRRPAPPPRRTPPPKPPAPRLTLENWRNFRLTCLGLFLVLSLLLLLGSILFSGIYTLLHAAPSNRGHDQQPTTSYAVYLDAYCWPERSWLPGQHSTSDLSGRRVHAPHAAFTWSCGRESPKLAQRDFDAACQQQYPGTAAEVGDPNNAYSWACSSHS
ncbi:J domain-containing protein [Streptomyces sp. NPDC059991]|uniref:J domain-containing protein n=1 Tax=Streptomyces sp. NPDC059991 TaxID=3347028 RepID=UPI003684F188